MDRTNMLFFSHQQAPFSKECPQRPYECMISTLKKMPWYMTGHITIYQRYTIYKATIDLIRTLTASVSEKRDEVNLSPQLLKRLVAAAMTCPGFTVLQKDDIAYITDMPEMEQRSFGQPRFGHMWRHQYALAPKPGVPLDVVEVSHEHRSVIDFNLSDGTNCGCCSGISRSSASRQIMILITCPTRSELTP
jgi:hypothetical protein